LVYLLIAMFSRSALLLWLAASLAPAVKAQTESWVQVRTPHFLVISNAAERDARKAAHQFEGMRSVFQRVFPKADLDAPPITVIAVQDRSSLADLEPTAYLGTGQLRLMGVFVAAPEKNYVLILLNAPGNHPYAPIYHEYAHFVFSRTQQWMPLWLTEGIAEYYQNTEILEDRVRLGKGDPSFQAVIERNHFLPLPTLFSVDAHSPYYHENDKGTVFYVESWALTHYLKDQDELEGTHRLQDFLSLLQKNVDPTAAATQAFGDLTELESNLRRYVVTGQYGITDVTGSIDVDDSSFEVQPITQAQADVARADLLAHDGREDDARLLLQHLLHNDPANPAALETMGFIAYRQQNYVEARKWCEQAIKLDPNSLVAHFFLGVAVIQERTADRASLALAEESFRAAIKMDPSFPFAFDGLAMLLTLHHTRLAEAYGFIEKAVQLSPGSPEIRADEAQVLSAMDKNEEAVAVLQLAVKMCHTPEQLALVENLLQNVRTYVAERTRLHEQNAAMPVRLMHPNGAVAKVPVGHTPPHAIYSPEVEYTEEARTANFQGSCVVSLIIGADGRPTNVALNKKLGMGMDERVIATINRWKFEPERRNGKAVASRMELTLSFKLQANDVNKFAQLSTKAQTGDAEAEFELAQAFFEGRDVPRDEKQGMALLERAARGGNTSAMLQMGERIYGDGTNSESYVAAYVWYMQARQGGDEQAQARISELESRMTPDQISTAKKQLGIAPTSEHE
jgi:TonB family protein